jgi:hypothetical protein
MDLAEKCAAMRVLITAFEEDAFKEVLGELVPTHDFQCGRSRHYAARLKQMVASLEAP